MQCDNCTKGYLAEGNPTGVVEKFAGFDTYFARPLEKSTKAIILAADAFGYTLNNSRLIADSLATHTGSLTIIPDFFGSVGGIPLDTFEKSAEERSKIFVDWLAKVGSPDTKVTLVKQIAQELKEKEGIRTIGVIGYCYGGPISALVAASDNLITAAAIAHPAPLPIPAAIEAIKVPTLWICAEIDHAFPPTARKTTQEILERRGMKSTFKDYPGTEHGFAVRGDEKNETIQKAKLDALEAAIVFFNLNFK